MAMVVVVSSVAVVTVATVMSSSLADLAAWCGFGVAVVSRVDGHISMAGIAVAPEGGRHVGCVLVVFKLL